MQSYYETINMRLKNRNTQTNRYISILLALALPLLIALVNVYSDSLLRMDRFQHLFICLAITLFCSAAIGKGKGILIFLFITILGLGKELTDHQMEELDLVANYCGWLLALLLILAMTALSRTKHESLSPRIS